MQPRHVAVVGAVGVTIGWLLASTLAPPVARVQSLPERPQPPAQAAEQPTFTEHFQERLRQLPPTPTGRRNPFVFGTRERIAPMAARASEDEPDTSAVSLSVPRGPAYSVSGIGITGDVRTAILSDGQNVRIVKVNDDIDGYTVVEITETHVTLARAGEQKRLHFAP
jgi:hypothetical protein